MYKKYIVRLTEEQRTQLETLLRSGRAHARKLLYGRILLKADADGPDHWTDEKIAEALEGSTATVSRERRRFCEEGLEVALMPRKPGRPRRRVLDGRAEAHLVALSCSEPPEGRERWSLRLLADRMVELGYADELSYETVRRTLKETVSSLTSNVSGCSLRGRARLSCGGWKRFWTSTKSLTTPCDRWSASTRGPANS